MFPKAKAKLTAASYCGHLTVEECVISNYYFVFLWSKLGPYIPFVFVISRNSAVARLLCHFSNSLVTVSGSNFTQTLP